MIKRDIDNPSAFVQRGRDLYFAIIKTTLVFVMLSTNTLDLTQARGSVNNRVLLCTYCVLLIIAFASCNTLAVDKIAQCEAANDVVPICGLQRPKDLEVMAGEQLILISEYGSLDGSVSGHLASY